MISQYSSACGRPGLRPEVQNELKVQLRNNLKQRCPRGCALLELLKQECADARDKYIKSTDNEDRPIFFLTVGPSECIDEIAASELRGLFEEKQQFCDQYLEALAMPMAMSKEDNKIVCAFNRAALEANSARPSSLNRS